MNILITGGAGYLGSVITRNLLENHNVTVMDNLMYNQTSLVDLFRNTNFKFIYGDVRDYKLLIEQVMKHDVIIPLAGIVGFPSCEKDKQLATQVNYNQIKDIVDNIHTDQRLLYPNTNSGYGSRGDGMVTEEDNLTPISHYGITKCDAEDYILNNRNGICLRLATVFGASPRMRTDLLVNDFIHKTITDGCLVLFQSHF